MRVLIKKIVCEGEEATLQTRMIVNYVKIHKKMQKTKRSSTTCSHIWHIDIAKCIICESLVKTQQFNHEWSSIMYDVCF